jgi:hypothetical protein
MNGLVKRAHFNSDIIQRKGGTRSAQKDGTSDMSLGNALDRLSSYVMWVPIKNKESASVLDALMRIKNFCSSHGHQPKSFVFDNEAVIHLARPTSC